MKEARYTPGSWKVIPPSEEHPSRAMVSSALGVDIYNAPLTAETEANANLIAAAPEMEKLLFDLINIDEADPVVGIKRVLLIGLKAYALLGRIRGET
ncbi:hypothetical protein [Prosthecochloris sp.]|uniref:hypothetical protein n=1 Tax=Prosthecochloris sp. TaxID=290513 RepID=UPI0025F12B9B|nr:hypothetical protein [Prosthecochloris sp.]